ncbi:MAG: hypothetical protein ACR2I7_04735 [Geodermatophilaceae bacterium]
MGSENSGTHAVDIETHRKERDHEISRKWKVISVGAALTGVALADTSTPMDDAAAIAPISVNAFEDTSPESAHSPNQSIAESADSPFDSPDDPGYVDPSPESADSPNQSANDSPPPAPAPAPQPGNGGGGGGGGDDDSASAGSAESADSLS